MEFKWIFLGVWILVMTTVVVGAVLLIVKARRMFAEIKAYAIRREWTFTRRGPAGLAERFQEHPFGRGRNRRVRNLMQGRHEGWPVAWFHYRYTTGSSRDGNSHGWTVLTLDLGVGPGTPYLSVAPAGRLSRLINKLTKTDIPVGDPVFDEAFTVKSGAPEFARDVLHRDLTRALMEWPDLAWRIEGGALVATRFGSHGVDEIDERLRALDTIVRWIPGRVWDRLRGEPPR